MKQQFFPSYTDGYSKIAGQDVAIMVCLPDAYSTSKKWPVKIFCHGMGQRGPGTTAALKTVFEGPYQAIPEDWKTGIDKYGIIGVLVNYNDFFQPASWRFVDNFLRANYSVVDKFMRQGFSWGGGSLNRAMQQSDIAAKTAVAIPIAPTIESGDTNWAIPAKSGAVIWCHVNSGDDVVGKGPAENIVKGINAAAPVVQATLTEYKQTGHGATNDALGLKPPYAPGGTGLIAAGENVDELYLRVLAGDVSVPKAGSGTSQPDTPTTPTNPSVELKAVASYSGIAPNIKLDGSKSTGFTFASWQMTKWPDGVSQWAPVVKSGGYHTSDAVLPAKGAYEFTLAVVDGAGNKSTATVSVIYGEATQPVPKVPASYDGVNLVYNDGSKEPATIVWSGGKFTATTAAGVSYPLQ